MHSKDTNLYSQMCLVAHTCIFHNNHCMPSDMSFPLKLCCTYNCTYHYNLQHANSVISIKLLTVRVRIYFCNDTHTYLSSSNHVLISTMDLQLKYSIKIAENLARNLFQILSLNFVIIIFLPLV